MLKISDKGLKDFEEEYKQIMLRKLKQGNAYNKNILAIKHKEPAQLIEKEIDNFLISKQDLKLVKQKIDDFKSSGIYSKEELKCLDSIFKNKNLDKMERNKRSYNSFFKGINNLIDDTNIEKNTKINHIEMESLLLCEYNEMKQVISDMSSLNLKKQLLESLKNFFDYTKYIDFDLRNTILNKIGINVCPYCGRQFISSYNDS